MTSELDPFPLVKPTGERVGFEWYMVPGNTFAPGKYFEQSWQAYVYEWTRED